jgi:pimeloyl-ACP methyl ester carboxylesterase
MFMNTVAFATGNEGLVPSRFLDVDGVSVAAYESTGNRGPGILMIHGNTSSANSFAKIMNSRFAKRYRVTAIDLPGYGESDDASALYNTAFYSNVISNAAEQLGVDEGVLVGWSLGGDFILQASTIMPNVKGLFMFGTAPVGYDPSLPAPFLTPEESYAGAAVNYGFVPNLPEQLINDYVTAFFKPNYTQIPQFFYDDGLRTDPMTRAALYLAATGQDPTFQDELQIVRTTTTPIAMLVGDQEAFVRQQFLDELAPQMPTLYKGKAIVVKNSGHAIHWERHRKVIKHLRKFIKTLD